MNKSSEKRKIKSMKSRPKANTSSNKNNTIKKISPIARPSSTSTSRNSPTMRLKRNKEKKPKSIKGTATMKIKSGLLILYKLQMKVLQQLHKLRRAGTKREETKRANWPQVKSLKKRVSMRPWFHNLQTRVMSFTRIKTYKSQHWQLWLSSAFCCSPCSTDA